MPDRLYAESSHNLHQCIAVGCTQSIDRVYVMCRPHWRMVPTDLKERIWDAHHHHNSTEWAAAVSEAQDVLQQAQSTKCEFADMVMITGDTFPVREQLKKLGGQWDPVSKGWRVPKAQKLVAQVLVGNAGQVETLPGLEDSDHA